MNSKIPEGYSIDNTQLMREINVDEHFLPTLGIKILLSIVMLKALTSIS